MRIALGMPKNLRRSFITCYGVKQRIIGSKGRIYLKHKCSCTLEISQIEKENSIFFSKSLKVKPTLHTHIHVYFTYLL